MRVLSVAEARQATVEELGLDPALFGVASIEAIAASLRRAAGQFCPCPPRTLVQSVAEPLSPLVDDASELEVVIENVLDSLVAYGDLLELPRNEEVSAASTSGNVLYAAEPCFIRRSSGAVLLLGVSPEGTSPLPDELETRIQLRGHARAITPRPDEDLAEQLRRVGIGERSGASWLTEPKNETASGFLERCNRLLDLEPPSGEVSGLTILDPSSPVGYYRARWRTAAAMSGRVIGRRGRRFGADLWCYVELSKGQASRLLNLPLARSPFRGCDDAWRIQAAIDSVRRNPQHYTIESSNVAERTLAVFSPIPMWAQRRWETIGRRVDAQGVLLAYAFAETEIVQEIQYAENILWLSRSAG